ncbi:uncharacterized protein LOC126577685 [Anopheles aquasalis]|uniref:uncharacterized protein LOC126577685 n=1 Tax=Anopheles aquasalis TaxID=42839 RepID=UPI00215A228C|nr:uncharacterized protein LOC126577685 [Anopheles aquasalis]
MCIAKQRSTQARDSMCWCFEEISLMILLQRILMYLWYRLLLKMFPRLSVMPACEGCAPIRCQPPCGQLADVYWKASQFSRSQLHPFPGNNFCKRIEEPTSAIDRFEEETLEELNEQFNFNCSDFSHVYQSTFLEEFDECFLPEDISWDVPIPELNVVTATEKLNASLLLNDYYIDDNLDDHLYAANFETAIGESMFAFDETVAE